MKLNLSKSGSLLILLVFSFLLIPLPSHANLTDADYIVTKLQTHDIPNDDGSGLRISWRPLPKERRIIEYRVYRGVTLDSLFFIGKIDVNVKTGVLADELNFYDTDFNYFLDTQAHGKLKREQGQPKDGVLFRRYPRDIKIVGPQLKEYDILAVIEENDFYYNTKKVEVEKDEETEVYGGIKLRHVAQFAKKLIADHEYYYTVVAVDEARRFHPHAIPEVGIPRDNSPEKPKEFFAAYVEDEKRLQFEWELASFADDHWHHSIYLLSEKDLAQYDKYLLEQKLKEENDVAVKEDPTLGVYEPETENPLQLIFRRGSGYPYTPDVTAAIQIEDNKIIDEENNIDVLFDENNLNDYYFVFSFDDYSGYETFSDKAQADIITTNDLPRIGNFDVADAPNDKGDYNLIMWEMPTVYITTSNYVNKEKTKLLINYEPQTNQNYIIRNIYFRVFDDFGKEIDFVNEYYLDNKIIVKLPDDSDKKQKLHFDMTFKCNKPLPEKYMISQTVTFDEISLSMMPGKALLQNGEYEEYLSDYQYFVYKKNYTSSEYRLSRKVNGSYRELADNIRHGITNFKIIKEYNEDKALYLFSPTFSLKRGLSANLYRSEMEKNKETYQQEIDKYTASKDTLETEAEIADAIEAIDYYTEQLENLENNPILQKASSYKSKYNRTKYLQMVRRNAVRSFEYKIVKSAGKARFSSTDVLVLDKPFRPTTLYSKHLEGWGTQFFKPWSNWFNVKMLPTLIASLLFGVLVFVMINKARKGHDLYIRPIAGIQEIDNAIGRATEMGKPILFVPGTSGIGDVATLAGLAILSKVAKKAAEYDTKILVPCRDYLVLPVAQEIVKEAHYEAGRPDSFDKGSVFFITQTQFAFVAGVNGIMVREKTATNFYMGMFWAEALLMTETGASTGAIQISGTDAVTQIPFFITTCDYTLIGEELYAASAYMAREPKQLGTLKAVDYLKLLILIFILFGTVLSTSHLTFLINSFPEK
ncbi:MAG: hypothetical protein K9N09_09965 [Candidatus Cloacimonetes bacterium]|nr:hypothetical protein [Candidatus Cloacimonadota bacterium]MCF7814421.1 hypothetical protein [Candidatus Cloacimonadota bacterium]MCF7869017.1 hypothetical protein [Candidatus Cloacimonadota bacterium]MCF7884405.1 hypothetical protein [Candidatus Cloacimonadota bacterium]